MSKIDIPLKGWEDSYPPSAGDLRLMKSHPAGHKDARARAPPAVAVPGAPSTSPPAASGPPTVAALPGPLTQLLARSRPCTRRRRPPNDAPRRSSVKSITEGRKAKGKHPFREFQHRLPIRGVLGQPGRRLQILELLPRHDHEVTGWPRYRNGVPLRNLGKVAGCIAGEIVR